MHSWRKYAISSIYQYVGHHRELPFFRDMEVSQALVIRDIVRSMRSYIPSREIVPIKSERDTAASCSIATSGSLSNSFEEDMLMVAVSKFF